MDCLCAYIIVALNVLNWVLPHFCEIRKGTTEIEVVIENYVKNY